jgi:CRP-like cAMP-binding protein
MRTAGSPAETVSRRAGCESHHIRIRNSGGTIFLGKFPPLLTHEEMASMTSTTRETVTRTLGQFRKDGWITIEDSLVTIRKPERLRMLL